MKKTFPLNPLNGPALTSGERSVLHEILLWGTVPGDPDFPQAAQIASCLLDRLEPAIVRLVASRQETRRAS